ncbi:MAG TPA: amidohydrolase family protein, partial [Thermohalobaculum sp.]|nr:amidohydrolase family protein [Thermohalobaculum sp.]
MTKVIKNGTVVAADRQYKADVLIEGETIRRIGTDLSGDETVDAEGAYVIPGGIDPHCHLEMPFMGTHSTDDFESGTIAAASGGTTSVVDFCIPNPDGGSMLEAWAEWEAKSKDRAVVDYAWHMCVTSWSENIWKEMDEVVRRGVN